MILFLILLLSAIVALNIHLLALVSQQRILMGTFQNTLDSIEASVAALEKRSSASPSGNVLTDAQKVQIEGLDARLKALVGDSAPAATPDSGVAPLV